MASREVSKGRGGGGIRLPPNYEAVQAAAYRVLVLRKDITMANFKPSQDLLQQIEAVLSDGNLLTVLAPAAQRGDATEVVAHLAVLQKSFANAGQAEASVFGKLMAADVYSLRPSAAAVEIACRTWRQTQKFLPAISEIMDAVRREQENLVSAVDFLKKLPETRARMQRDLDRE